MKRNKHKRKVKHILLVTSDSAQTGVRQFLFKPGFLWTVILVLCILLSALAAYVVSEKKIWDVISLRNEEQLGKIQQLETEKQELLSEIDTKETEKNALNSEIESLNQRIVLLSDTVNEKVQSEAELSAKIESQSTPTLFPLTGLASMEDTTENDAPATLFQASAGSTVVATASGTVVSVTDDASYGHCVTVDHGNGYVTIYKNSGDTNIKAGDNVVQGTTLFLITNDNNEVCYQITKDGEYINPDTMISIDG